MTPDQTIIYYTAAGMTVGIVAITSVLLGIIYMCVDSRRQRLMRRGQ